MLRITIEAFSGREAPSYLMGGAEARELLHDVSRRPEVVTDSQAGFDGLGFRGVIVESLSDDDEENGYGLPHKFKIAGGAAMDQGNGFDLAERLIRALPSHQLYSPTGEAQAPVGEDLVNYLLGLLRQTSERRQTALDSSAGAEPTPEDVTCYYERSKFNPGFWNDPSVIGKNNCYNYASNRRTDTFAQPGRGAGAQYTALSCAEVTRGALADGCHRRYVCFPDSEKPRRLVALVVAPGYDYHWYRIHTAAEGFWGHKPGGTAARNTDNSNRVIVNPETCDRGPYTQFCGYFYTCKTQADRIR